MPCYKPIQAYHAPHGGVTFKKADSFGTIINLPCGQCIGCRLDKSREWAIRCVHEAQLYEPTKENPDANGNCFITLTYAPEHLPHDGSLDVKHWQKFMKRLRKKYPDEPIRYYHCGEYGEKLKRPHYHACLFNHDFEDKEILSQREGTILYQSDILNKLWGMGFCSIGTVTFESAAYVARYIMKKINGQMAADHYESIDQVTGEIINLKPEYTTMSRKPGLGRAWYEQFSGDVFPDDFVILKGRKLRTPRYYLTQLKNEDPETYEKIMDKRKKHFELHEADSTPERLSVREKCKARQIQKLTRSLENES